MKIYHNPRCRKSREALSILIQNNIQVEVIEYLKTPITKKELCVIINKLGISASDLVRKEEKLYKELYKDKKMNETEYINILYENPILIQRPIIIKDNRAVIGRPPINVLDLLQ
tara:strand:- start:18 stop:359 length:342 start_codon:yes stop_codon:yes gene_type:complete